MQNMLNSAALHDAAAARTRLHDFGDPHYLQALQALLEALTDEAQLSPQGMWRTIPYLISALGHRALVTDTLKKHPEIRDLPIEAPLFITGFPRTGTTLLHNLLACDPANRAPLLWELQNPVTPPDAPDTWRQDTIRATEALLAFVYKTAPDFARIHPMQAEAPDECSWLLRKSFASMVHAFTYHIPSYVEWLHSLDHDAVVKHYREYRAQLQLLLWRRPGQRLVLKDPCHAWHLDALLEVFPDARVIHLHRDLAETLPSLASLCTALQHLDSDVRDPRRVGAYALRLVETAAAALLRERPNLPPGAVLDTHYKALIQDPAQGALELERRAGRAPAPDAEASMRAWLLANQQHKAGRHAYTLEQFSLSRDQISQRLSQYTSTFLPA